MPDDEQSDAYADRALAIDCGQTISQPYIVALMTEALELTGTESVLEIGTGSGYQTAVLCELARWVTSVERHRGAFGPGRGGAEIAGLSELHAASWATARTAGAKMRRTIGSS